MTIPASNRSEPLRRGASLAALIVAVGGWGPRMKNLALEAIAR